MKKPELLGMTHEQIAYLEYLEGCLNGSSELILALNIASRVFARDLNLLCDGDAYAWEAEGEEDKMTTRLTLLSDDAKNKTFDRIMVLFDKFDKIKALSQHFKGQDPIQQGSQTNKLKVPANGNVFETAIDLVKNGKTNN